MYFVSEIKAFEKCSPSIFFCRTFQFKNTLSLVSTFYSIMIKLKNKISAVEDFQNLYRLVRWSSIILVGSRGKVRGRACLSGCLLYPCVCVCVCVWMDWPTTQLSRMQRTWCFSESDFSPVGFQRQQGKNDKQHAPILSSENC